jgi:hypothetical protein
LEARGRILSKAFAPAAASCGAKTYESVKSILDNKLDRRPVAKRATEAAPILHPDIRGPHYYH